MKLFHPQRLPGHPLNISNFGQILPQPSNLNTRALSSPSEKYILFANNFGIPCETRKLSVLGYVMLLVFFFFLTYKFRLCLTTVRSWFRVIQHLNVCYVYEVLRNSFKPISSYTIVEFNLTSSKFGRPGVLLTFQPSSNTNTRNIMLSDGWHAVEDNKSWSHSSYYLAKIEQLAEPQSYRKPNNVTESFRTNSLWKAPNYRWSVA